MSASKYVFHNLHNAILRNLNNVVTPTPYFHVGKKTAGDPKENYNTFVVATFSCKNEQCSSGGWKSGKVGILIRRYANNGYHTTVFNQRCKCCNQLGHMELDKSSYIDRVSYRLKRWAGVKTEPRKRIGRTEMPPHKQELCEGCELGFCERGGATIGWSNDKQKVSETFIGQKHGVEGMKVLTDS